MGGPQGRFGRAETLAPTGIRFRTVQPVVSRYTDYATRTTPPKFRYPIKIKEIFFSDFVKFHSQMY